MTYYFCSLCSDEREDPKNWFEEKELPTHLFREHNHRMRNLEEILKEWGSIGLIETTEILPKNKTQLHLKLPIKTY